MQRIYATIVMTIAFLTLFSQYASAAHRIDRRMGSFRGWRSPYYFHYNGWYGNSLGWPSYYANYGYPIAGSYYYYSFPTNSSFYYSYPSYFNDWTYPSYPYSGKYYVGSTPFYPKTVTSRRPRYVVITPPRATSQYTRERINRGVFINQ